MQAGPQQDFDFQHPSIQQAIYFRHHLMLVQITTARNAPVSNSIIADETTVNNICRLSDQIV